MCGRHRWGLSLRLCLYVCRLQVSAIEVSRLGVGTQVYVYVLLFIREMLHTTLHDFALGDG